MATEKPESLITNGVRLDGRMAEEMRPLKIIAGYLDKAEGSAYVECGGTKVIAACYGPREVHPRHLTITTETLVRARYDMASFSVEGERKRPGPDRRSTEISKVVSEALTSAVFVEKYPKTAIDVFIEVISAEASTRVAGLTAASVALADAGIAMRDLVAACSFGKIYGTEKGKDVETVAVDMGKSEDNFGLADVAVGYMPNLKKVVLLQMDGHLTVDEFRKGLPMSISTCESIYQQQLKALKAKFKQY
jgi:exosome complex component RRP41